MKYHKMMLTVQLSIQTPKHFTFVKPVEMRLRFRRDYIPSWALCVPVYTLTIP